MDKVAVEEDGEGGDDHGDGLGITLSSAAEAGEIMADLRIF